MADSISVISSMATQQLLADLAQAYHRTTADRVRVQSVGGVDATRRVQAGEAFDVVVLAAGAIDLLAAQGLVLEGSRRDLVESGVAVAVRAGTQPPDIADEAALKAAVLDARTVGYSTGPSGLHLQSLFARWGVADAVAARVVQAPPGVAVGSLIAQGRVELGFQQLSELLHLPGIDVIGPLPQGTQIVTTFSAGVTPHAGQPAAVGRLLDFMTSTQVDEIKRRHGMKAPDPVTAPPPVQR